MAGAWGLRRRRFRCSCWGCAASLANPAARPIGVTTAALWLSFCGGHPESFFHQVAAGAVYFAWELAGARRSLAPRAIGMALGAGGLALLLCGPQLFPLLEAIPHSAEYRARRGAVAAGHGPSSVPTGEAAARLLPDLLPFAHGIYGKSSVDTAREDGSGMPLGYAGAVLFPLALLALTRGPAVRGRAIFLAFTLAGFAYGASAPGVMDLTARLPGFALALNYRLVFLAGLGLSGLAALGVQSLSEAGGAKRLAVASGAVALALVVATLAAQPVFVARGLDPRFVRHALAFEVVPVLLLAVVAARARRRPVIAADAVLVFLVLQRFLEMRGTYPTLPATTLAPPLSALAALPLGSDPARVVAAGGVFRPNAAALYRIEDVRGYESLVLDRFADTFPLWSQAQPASFNRVTDLTRPFLSFLNVRYAIAAPEDPAPAGWLEQARGPGMAVFFNAGALPRAFVPRILRRAPDAAQRLAAMARASDFAEAAWLGGAGAGDEPNGRATLRVRAVGPDLVVAASVSTRAFVATSLPDWPGWVAASERGALPTETVNHAFVGFWLEAGVHTVRLTYRPRSWTLGLAAFAAGAVAAAVLFASGRRRDAGATPAQGAP